MLHERQVLELRYELSRCKVDMQRYKQRIALLKIKWTSCEEDLSRYRKHLESLKGQYEIELAGRTSVQGLAMRLQSDLATAEGKVAEQGELLQARQVRSDCYPFRPLLCTVCVASRTR